MCILQGDLADSDRRRQAADIVILQGDLADSNIVGTNRRRQGADIVYSSGRSG